MNILRHVNVVLCMLIIISDSTLYSYFSSHVIYVNEVNKAAENEIWNIMTHYNSQVIVLIEDQNQLKFTVMFFWKDNDFHDQLTKLLFNYLIVNEHNYVMLRMQHHMHLQILYLVNKMFYKKQLHDAVNVAKYETMSAHLLKIFNAVKTLNEIFFNLQDKHNVLIDVTDNHILINIIMSHWNVFNLSTDIRLIMNLLTFTRLSSFNSIIINNIVILTLYQIQYEDYVKVFEQLYENHLKTDYNKIKSQKIDDFQEEETSIVIVNLIITNHADFLHKCNHLNMIISWAQMTQYILLFIFMFHESIKKKDNTQKSLLDITQHFKKKDWIVKQHSHSSFSKSVAALLTTIIEDVTKNEIANDQFISVSKQMIKISDDVTEKIQNSSMTA